MFDKMTWIIYLGAQNDPEIGPHLGPIFNTPLKVVQIDIYTKTDAQPVGNFWENDKDRNYDFGGPKWLKNWASEGHILHTSESILEWACERNTVVKPVKTFWESDQTPEIFLTLGPKWPRNWAFGAHILHIYESSSNAHIKQDWCESRQNVWKPEFWLIWRPKMDQNLGLWCLSFTHLQK